MNARTTVGQLVVERPSRARVFEKFGIDYCCGGKKALDKVCQEKGVDLVNLIYALGAADGDAAPATTDWAAVPLGELADHIQETHHAYLKTELPRLEYLINKVSVAHGARHPELADLRELFATFKAEMDQHMQKEEGILFPICRELDAAKTKPQSHCGSVGNPIAVMIREHDDAGEALARFRDLTQGYLPPEGACNTYRAMLSSLAELEADMHQHVHKENNILFPGALRREQAL